METILPIIFILLLVIYMATIIVWIGKRKRVQVKGTYFFKKWYDVFLFFLPIVNTVTIFARKNW